MKESKTTDIKQISRKLKLIIKIKYKIKELLRRVVTQNHYNTPVTVKDPVYPVVLLCFYN